MRCVYVVIDARTREAGTSGEGIINKIFTDWLNFETSPATFILAVIIIVVIFVAPFGVVGLLKRIARYFVVIVPKPAGTQAAVPVLASEAAEEVEEAPAS